MDNRKIGVFDSGVGGLTVVSEIYKQLPDESIVYFGDTARNPYGIKDKETINLFCNQILQFLNEKNVKAVVIACNTATLTSLNILKKNFDIPIIGILEAGIISAIDVTKNKNIGVIGTDLTVNSNDLKNILYKYKEISFYLESFQELVYLAEQGLNDSEQSDLICKEKMKILVKNNIDTLVLACTHFPMHMGSISKAIGNENIYVVNPAIKIVYDLKKILIKNDMLAFYKNQNEFYVSGDDIKFNYIYKNINKVDCKSKKINIEKY